MENDNAASAPCPGCEAKVLTTGPSAYDANTIVMCVEELGAMTQPPWSMPPLPAGWRVIQRENSIVEYACPHGVGHPVAVKVMADFYRPIAGAEGIHGCDGCCGILRATAQKP